ncbi:hypothetical protein, partial [Microvirga aerophila]|uniref:hypothetical protein n=1 Tax=Microvirga aerophila TaxID=670291 RepID=UPI001AEF17A6
RLVARTKKRGSSHSTLKRVKRRPDIGHVPDISRAPEYQCVICGFILAQARNETSRTWRFGK